MKTQSFNLIKAAVPEADLSRSIRISSLAAIGLAIALSMPTSSLAQLEIAPPLFVDVDATALSPGPILSITNSGSLGGFFYARGGGTTVPVAATVDGGGTMGIRFDGGDYMQHVVSVGGALVPAPAGLVGVNPTCTIEVWVLNGAIDREETILAWGRRGGAPDASNMPFNYGWDAAWGAVGHWGPTDIGWTSGLDGGGVFGPGVPSAGVWHHLVYTFDGSTQRVYADGVQKNSEVVALNTAAGPPIILAAQTDSNGTSVAPTVRGSLTIGKVRIHDGVLSASQIATNYLLEVSAFTNGPGIPLLSGPAHRYQFNNAAGAATAGSIIQDSVGTANGTVLGTGANFTGSRLTLPGGASGTAAYVDLPDGLLSGNSTNKGGSGEVTIEGWVRVTGNRAWSRIFDFGSSSGGSGQDYLLYGAQINTDVYAHRLEVKNADGVGGTGGGGTIDHGSTSFGTNLHFAITWNDATGEMRVYENGEFAIRRTETARLSQLNDVNVWLGRSQYTSDQNMQGEFDELRIYNRALSDAELRGNFLRGPSTVLADLATYTVSGGGTNCGGVPVGLSGSEVGVSYLLRTNSGYAGVAVDGTGSAISFGTQVVNGVYSVLASNTATAVTALMSGSVAALVTGNPVITVQPANLAVCGNPSVSFSVAVTASTTPTYQWRKDGVNLANGPTGNGSTISGATGATLTINPVTASDSADALGGYDCVISAPCPTNSARVALVVNAQPTAFAATGGGSDCAAVPVGLSGSEIGVDYRLLTNGVFNGQVLSGNGSPLTFGNQTLSRTFTIQGSNTVGGCTALMSGSAVVTIVVAPIITSGSNPANFTNYQGGYLLFSVAATGSPLTYQWQRDGTNLVNGGRISGATSPNLTIVSVGPADSVGASHGYTCMVSNSCGTVFSAESIVTIIPFDVVDAGFNPGASSRFINGGDVEAFAIEADGKILVGGNFTTLGGQLRDYLGRLNADGTLDGTFNPGASSTVQSLAIQADGKILAGGNFGGLGGQPRSWLGRLNADGVADSGFNPSANSALHALVLQADGKILAGGQFTTLGGQTRNRIARLNADGTLDTSFNPGANADVYSLAVQPDGKILVGGLFTTLGGQSRSYLGRLNADGTLDNIFNPGAGPYVFSLAVQADGKILVGGIFSTLGGQSRNCIGRLNADGTLDNTFNPGANSQVLSFAVQADGKILVSGSFTILGGLPCNHIGRLNPDGTLDLSFNPDSNGSVLSLAVQPEGKIVVGGNFTTLGGESRNWIGRLNNTAPATQSLTYDGSNITWLRGGTSPEVWRTTFEASTNGIDVFPLGTGQRVAGGWQLAVSGLPPQTTLRARGYVSAGQFNASSWFVEQYIGRVLLVSQPVSRTNEAGTTASFKAVSGGSEPLAYQWRSSCGELPFATNSVLSLDALTTNQSGCTYWVEVSNPYGTVTSAVATLTVVTLGDAVNMSQSTWSSAGILPWTVQTTYTHDGVMAAQSGAITHSQESWLETTVNGPGQLSFWWSVSSETNLDFLEFQTNGVLAMRISGTVPWQQQAFTLGPGIQSLRWRYVKDSSVSSGQDRGYLDEVSFVGAGNNPPALVNSISDQPAIYGTPFNFTLAANAFADPDAGQSLSYSASGLPAGISFTPVTRTFSGTPGAVGTNSVTVTATDNGSPALSTNDVFDIVIAKAPLTVTGDNQFRIYAETNPPLTFSYSAFVLGETAAVLDTLPVAGTAATNGSAVGPYPITIGGGVDDHYEFSYVNGTLTVTPAPLIVTANDTNRVYGTPNPPLEGSLVGVAWSDNITATFATTATIADPPGAYQITPILSDPDGKLSNYAVTTNNATLTVSSPPELSITSGGGGLITLSWPASYGSFVLEFTESLTPPIDWQPVTNGITENGGVKSYTVMNDPNVSGRLYRLRLP